jgi:hypothetical protein
VVGAVIGPCTTGERTQAGELTGVVQPGMLLLADSGFYSCELLGRFAATGADLAWRVGASVSLGCMRWLSDGSYLALIYRLGLGAERRRRLVRAVAAGGEVPADVARLVRVVDYTVPDRNPAGELITVITTILDPPELSGVDLATAYHDRWEEESALNEIKSDLRGRGEVLRSKTPELVQQQVWGLLLAHYAIRALLVDAADEAGYGPDRLSFIRGLRLVRRQVTDQAAISPWASDQRQRRGPRRDPSPPATPAPPPRLSPGRQTRPAQLLPRQTIHRPDHPSLQPTHTHASLPEESYLNGIGPGPG